MNFLLFVSFFEREEKVKKKKNFGVKTKRMSNATTKKTNNAQFAPKTRRTQRRDRSNFKRGLFTPRKVRMHRGEFTERLSRVEDTFIARESDWKVR
jgi:hypothetical protein